MPTRQSEREYELEVLPGLEGFALAELRELAGARPLDGLRFAYAGGGRALKRLRSVQAVYLLEHFEVPRPKALLGHAHLSRLLALIGEVAAQDSFASFRFGAAGGDSAVFARLSTEIENATGLKHDPREGELLIRFRRAGAGWDALLRLTPRPLSARSWRACNLAGGLNATLANAMLRLGGVRESDRVFNPMTGSGTLLIERAALGPAERLAGADLDPEALRCARENVRASGYNDIELHELDVTEPGTVPERAFDLIVADLPWGDAVGDHAENAELYPAFLTAMSRAASKRARMVVLTHEVRLFETLLSGQHFWKGRESLKVFHGGHHPRMYLLTKG